MSADLPITLTVNGRPRRVSVAAHHTLLEVLREDLGLTGAKECCLVGECGACTVRLNGRIVDSCLVLGVEADGGEVLTVEGLGDDGRAGVGRLSALQQSFLDHAAAQCGYCIPGQLVAASALLAETPRPTRADVEDGLAGNLCRCAGYEQIIEAVLATAAVTVDDGAGERTVRPAGPDPASVPDASVAPQ